MWRCACLGLSPHCPTVSPASRRLPGALLRGLAGSSHQARWHETCALTLLQLAPGLHIGRRLVCAGMEATRCLFLFCCPSDLLPLHLPSELKVGTHLQTAYSSRF